MQQKRIEFIKKYGFEFLTIFIGVFAAFALDNWNSNRKDHSTELKILSEIRKGLIQDTADIALNEQGHNVGLDATRYFGKIILDKPYTTDSLHYHYSNLLRDFLSVQNVSGYETLKSKGLDIIANDSLRTQILSLYENDYNSLRKLEENYDELQFFKSYHQDFANSLASNFIIHQNGMFQGINHPLKITEKEKNILLLDLWKMANNRIFILAMYADVKKKIEKLQQHLKKELDR